ncbi:methyl-accepting chemotaxis protein [Shumkonia mesophila]|uniref:methyl-accepting chemotaxis protein n=1 Tax=Shumkonia mesophila TaxID=2838854 RepID=UPI002934C6EF|nr:methyl-accepting chemotaxis protein [Shumkonia mesophila]
MINRLKISAKIALSFAVMIAVMVIGSTLVLVNVSRLGETTQTEIELSQFRASLDRMGEGLDDQRAAILDLLITGNRSVLANFEAGKTRFATALADLQNMAGKDAQSQALLSAMAAGYERWSKEIAQRQIALMGNAMTVNEARALEVSGLPAELMAEITKAEHELISLKTEVSSRARDDAQTALGRVNLSSWISGILVALIAVAAGLALSRLIAGPIRSMSQAMLKLADGDTTVAIPGIGKGDEIGEMAAAVQVFKDNKIEADRLAEEQRREQEARAARAKRIEDLCKAFDATSTEAVKSVAAAATEMRSSSEAMSATAEEATRQASAVAAASEQASANVQTVASAAEELSSSISEISRQVTQASQIASAAVSEAEQTNIKVQGLAQAANKIGEVVALITDIAEQTNLLALNATIEAARAGDAGKGFAVVASEVKNLANQTAKATDEIGAQIAGIQAATQEAVSAIESITRTISKINEVNAGVASAVEEQGAATQEIARNVEQAAAGTQEVSSNIGGVSQAANETGTAAEQIYKAAGELSQQSEKLRAEVDKFLDNVRSA